MNPKPRTREHARATLALGRFHKAHRIDSQLHWGKSVAAYLERMLTENAELRNDLTVAHNTLASERAATAALVRRVCQVVKG